MSDGLIINNLEKKYIVDGKEINVLENIDLNIKKGEFIAIVGHSGCGKSTLLKIIAGLETADKGTLINKGKEISGPDIDRGMIFQEHRLCPWLSIEKNVALGLKKISKIEKSKKIEEYLELVKLSDFKKAYPKQLSGGMSQRAAIARAIILHPEILLLDEPFGALDALTKIELQEEIKKIWKKEKTTMIMVTHDIEEAVFLADRVVVMSSRPGKIRDIVNVELGVDRDRGSADFAKVKKKIYNYFFESAKGDIEYTI
jgi:ABC-type nitrate/sulfonate/bicarbonate transport system ATPase subunit